MLPAIHFDQQLQLHAGEIGHVPSDRDLPLELNSFQPVRAQPIPEPALRVGNIGAQGFGEIP